MSFFGCLGNNFVDQKSETNFSPGRIHPDNTTKKYENKNEPNNLVKRIQLIEQNEQIKENDYNAINNKDNNNIKIITNIYNNNNKLNIKLYLIIVFLFLLYIL